MQRYLSRASAAPCELRAYTCVAFSTDAPPIRIGLLARDTTHAYETAHELFPTHRIALAELTPEW
jgi:hypothetical protein